MSKLWAALALLFFVSSVIKAREVILIEEQQKPPGVGPEYDDYLRKKKERREELLRFREGLAEEKDRKIQALMDERKAKIDPRATSTVTVDDYQLNITEPKNTEEALNLKKEVRDLYEVSPEDFTLMSHERWELNLSDFQFDRPRYVVFTQSALKTRRAFMFTYSITNSTTKRRRIAPLFTVVTDKGVFMPETSGYLPLRMAADSTFHPLAGSSELRDRQWLQDNVIPMESPHQMGSTLIDRDGSKYKLSPMETFEPGQTRWGAAIWPDFNDEWTEMKIVVHGLSNNHRYEERQRRVMVMNFSRNDDEFHVERSLLRFHNKEWKWLWMWDQDLSVPIPTNATDPQIKESLLDMGFEERRLVWSFPYEIGNSTRNEEQIEVRQSRFVLPMEVKVGNESVPVEVEVVDDGRSTIFKAQYIREQGFGGQLQEKNRFVPDANKIREVHHRTHKIKPGEKASELRAIFDAGDVDWRNAYEQVENYLSLKLDLSKLAKERWEQAVAQYAKENKKIAESELGGRIGYDPRRRLTDDLLVLKDERKFQGQIVVESEKSAIVETLQGARLEFPKTLIEKIELGEKTALRKQIAEQIPAALQKAKEKKEVVAFFTANAGLASGKYRTKRSYRQRGVIQDDWLSAWEALDKPE